MHKKSYMRRNIGIKEVLISFEYDPQKICTYEYGKKRSSNHVKALIIR